jgi:glyoxylase-like metal-dependent hydrolase (beta-lactamase superfamily II)
MSEYRTIAILVFRIFRGRYHFYLVRRGINMPAFPKTWTTIGSVITAQDFKVAEELEKKYGDISDHLADKVTALRLLLERDLIHDTELLSSVPLLTDVRQKILKMDPAYLMTFFSSMIPWGRHRVNVNEDILDSYYYLYIVPTSSILEKGKLSQYSEYMSSKDIVLEDRNWWFKSSKIVRKYNQISSLFDPIVVNFVTKFHNEKKKLVDVARELDKESTDAMFFKMSILPKILKFETPAPTRTPFNLCNIYIIGNERQYIIDPGSTTSKAITVLEKYVEENLDKIEGILLTNHIVDHCNQALHFKEKFDIPLFASEETAKELSEEGLIFNSYLKEGMKIYLGSYEPLGLKKWELTVVGIPGYTKGQLGYYDPRGVLFSGSLLHKGIISTIGKYDGALSDFLSSLRKVSKLKPKYVLSGHRDIITDVKGAINFNLKNLKKYEGFILSLIQEGKSALDDFINAVFENSDLEWRDSAVNLVLLLLSKLTDENKIQKRGEDYFCINGTK